MPGWEGHCDRPGAAPVNCTCHKGRRWATDHHTMGPVMAQGLPVRHRRVAGSRPHVGSPWSRLSGSPCLEWSGKWGPSRSSHLDDLLPVYCAPVRLRQRGNWIPVRFPIKRLPQVANSFHDKGLAQQAPQQLVKHVSMCLQQGLSCVQHCQAPGLAQHQEGKIISSSETWWLSPGDIKSGP